MRLNLIVRQNLPHSEQAVHSQAHSPPATEHDLHELKRRVFDSEGARRPASIIAYFSDILPNPRCWKGQGFGLALQKHTVLRMWQRRMRFESRTRTYVQRGKRDSIIDVSRWVETGGEGLRRKGDAQH